MTNTVLGSILRIVCIHNNNNYKRKYTISWSQVLQIENELKREFRELANTSEKCRTRLNTICCVFLDEKEVKLCSSVFIICKYETLTVSKRVVANKAVWPTPLHIGDQNIYFLRKKRGFSSNELLAYSCWCFINISLHLDNFKFILINYEKLYLCKYFLSILVFINIYVRVGLGPQILTEPVSISNLSGPDH
jgi:hypothetical protein